MKKMSSDLVSCPIKCKNYVYLLALAIVTTVISCNDSDTQDDPDYGNQQVAGPTITWGSNADSTDVDIEDGMDVKFKFDVPAGIMVCRIYANSALFKEEGITDIDLINPSEKVKAIAESVLGGGGSPEGMTSYTLDLSPFGRIINDLTAEETQHTVTVMVADNNNKRCMRTVVFHRLKNIDAMNTALKVCMFTPFNVRSIDGDKVTFQTSLNDDSDGNFFTYSKLSSLGLTAQDGSEILRDDDGNGYRIPTAGELNLLVPMFSLTNRELGQFGGGSVGGALFPCWGEDYEIAPEIDHTTLKFTEKNWVETVCLRNRLNNAIDNLTMSKETDGEFRVSGKSFLKRHESADTNIVYGLRFQETSQCAAYRWEYKNDNNPQQSYLSIKIRALGKYDVTTRIEDVADESFWTGDYIEFTFPASGYYDSATAEVTNSGVGGLCWSSSLTGSKVYALFFDSSDAYVTNEKSFELLPDSKCPLRLVRITQ